eukprot:5135819-Prymnesium_polylepis.1
MQPRGRRSPRSSSGQCSVSATYRCCSSRRPRSLANRTPTQEYARPIPGFCAHHPSIRTGVPHCCLQAVAFSEVGSVEHGLFTDVFDTAERMLTAINEEVRAKEAQARMLRQVSRGDLHGRERSLHALLAMPHMLELEMFVDMKGVRMPWLKPEWTMRREYKWFVFADALLICRKSPLHQQGFAKKLIIAMPEVQVSMTDESGVGTATAEESSQLPTKAVEPDGWLANFGRFASFGRGTAARSIAANAAESHTATDNKSPKPEVFFLRSEGEVYECWAPTEAQRRELVALQQEHHERRMSFSRGQSDAPEFQMAGAPTTPTVAVGEQHSTSASLKVAKSEASTAIVPKAHTFEVGERVLALTDGEYVRR